MKLVILICCTLFPLHLLLAQGKGTPIKKDDKSTAESKRLELITQYGKYKEILATVDTNFGSFKIRLEGTKAPLTVENFIGLTEGTKEFIDQKDGKNKKTKRPFYDGLTFHRVSPNFVIQGGCPVGNGTGGPGYTFEGDLHPGLTFDKKGVVAMASSEFNRNGSQFFITLAPVDLNGKYAIFGQISEGMDVVEKIGKLDTYPNERPKKKVIINSIKIDYIKK